MNKAGECIHCGSTRVSIVSYPDGPREVAERHNNGVQCSSRRMEYAQCEACGERMQGSAYDLWRVGTSGYHSMRRVVTRSPDNPFEDKVEYRADDSDDVPQPDEGPVRPIPLPNALSFDNEGGGIEERHRRAWARDQQRLQIEQRQRDIALVRERDMVRTGAVMRGLTDEEQHMPLNALVNDQLERHRRDDADAAAGVLMQGIHNELFAARDAALRHAISDSMLVERGELPEPPEPAPVVELPIASAQPPPRRFKLHYD